MHLGFQDRGLITDSLKLRTEASTNENVIAKMPAEYVFTVIGGPKCNEGFTWWNIQGTMGTGWAAEAGEDNGHTYWWMAPMTDPPVVVIVTNTPVPPVVIPTNTLVVQSGTIPTNTPQPLVEAPIETIASEEPFYCSWWIIGWIFCDLAEDNTTLAADVNIQCNPQCMKEARDKRPDMNLWSPGTGDSTSSDVYKNALSKKNMPFLKDGIWQEVRVRADWEFPETGDIIIWPKGCGDNIFGIVTFDGGHIGTVQSYQDNNLIIHDANWNNKCGIRNEQVKLLACMEFITSPYPYVPPQSTP